MGANFINTCLEKNTEIFKSYIEEKILDLTDEKIDFVMSILSNYTLIALSNQALSVKSKI